MTKSAALYSFWSSFGLKAFDEQSVPTGENAPEFPYITFERAIDGLGSVVALSASVWYRDSSVVDINAKTEEISKAFIDRKLRMIPCDGGGLLFFREQPFAQPLKNENDEMIKRTVINYSVMFITSY